MDETDQRDHYSDSGITTSFSQLLFSDINHSDVFCSDLGPKMLCFDGGFNDSPACNSSSSSSVITAAATGGNFNANAAGGKPNRRRNGSSGSIVKASSSARRSSKKMKMESPCNSTGQPKARKEKLGERIAALQQLVSPFGKTDTASVLHEAMGYIRFLHDQLQVLCSPYLQQSEGKENGGEEPKELRSRGLCLVPVECTLHVASSNGADYWSPVMSATRQ